MNQQFQIAKVARRPPGFPTTNVTNELADAVNGIVPALRFGQARGELSPVAILWGTITATGPAGAADYADARYWVQVQSIQPGAITDAIATDPDGVFNGGDAITATNQAEVPGGTHLLRTDDAQDVTLVAYTDGGGATRYAFSLSPPSAVLFTVTGSRATGGEYDGTLSAGVTAIGVNLVETASTHVAVATTVISGVIVGRVNDAGTWKYKVDFRYLDGAFPVTVSQTGGTAGDNSHFCTFTYDVAYNGITIATGVAVDSGRILKAAFVAGTKGLAYLAPAVKLYSVNETITTVVCT